jgi:eukaryotic-like serine/threonine-protein kinase
VMPYIVAERIPGGSLLALFGKAPLPLSEVLEATSRMATAVHDLHRQHVIHLDLKPANFLQRPSGDMVCVDYGLSRHDDLPDLLTEEFTIPMGTWPYIAPEQFLRQRGDLRSDIFALGAMTYELATGKLPFGEPQSLKGVRKRLWRDPVPPRALRPDLPKWLQEIILRALEVDPARRYQTAAQMIFDLSNPHQVRLTERGRKQARDSAMVVFHRWRKMRHLRGFAAPVSMSAQIDRAPILMVAVDLAPQMEALSERLRLAVQRMLMIQPDARVACVNVIRTNRMAIDQGTDANGNNLHVARLVGLKHWASSIELPDDRLTFTVLEGTDPGAVLVDHATANAVDHIIMGARGHSTTRRYLGSVSSHVVAEAACSVTVIRLGSAEVPQAPAADAPATEGASADQGAGL